MKTLFYPRLAWDGLRKNRRLSLPYLLTCVCMVSMFYILSFLASEQVLALIPRGKSSVALVLTLGKYVILLFSLIFLFYTYSFLLRRRAREFGLYNVLGMGRRNLIRIISWENLITFAAALLGGLLTGILLSKVAELGLINLLSGEIDYRIRLDLSSVFQTILFFAVIFGLIWLSAVIRVSRSSAVTLMKAENMGEKPPKGNWLVALLGVILLAAAYWLAVSIENPISALLWFFIAVLMVILATYLLMIAGSVRLCRILQNRKSYYYKAAHFVSVSSMVYRMKRNGAGLASICIIATMILVMLSSTTCMWFGADDSLRVSYPRDLDVTVHMIHPRYLTNGYLAPVREKIAAFMKEKGGRVENVQDQPSVVLNGLPEKDGIIQCDHDIATDGIWESNLLGINLVSAETYTEDDGSHPVLAADEAILLTSGMDYSENTITLAMGEVTRSWNIRSSTRADTVNSASRGILMVVSDLSTATEGFQESGESGSRKLQIMWRYHFDTGLSDEENIRIGHELEQELSGFLSTGLESVGFRVMWVDSRALGAADFFGTYGSLFFIGILLSVVFLLAAVLIIYYKQISEGYEDAKRFDIMQKVGMTKREIRSSVSSQLLTVFALPLLFAGLHLLFAFPMIRRVLTLFSLYNVGLFIRTTVISFVAFSAFYAVVYRLTSGIYYRIVSGAETR